MPSSCGPKIGDHKTEFSWDNRWYLTTVVEGANTHKFDMTVRLPAGVLHEAGKHENSHAEVGDDDATYPPWIGLPLGYDS